MLWQPQKPVQMKFIILIPPNLQLISVNGITMHAIRPNTFESSLTLLTLTPTPNQEILGALLQRQMSQQLRKLPGLGAFSSMNQGGSMENRSSIPAARWRLTALSVVSPGLSLGEARVPPAQSDFCSVPRDNVDRGYQGVAGHSLTSRMTI